MLKAAALAIYGAMFIMGSSSISAAEFYQWQDDKGGVHFTDNPDNVPAPFKKKLLKRELTTEPGAASDDKKAVAAPQPAPPASTNMNEQVWRGRFLQLRSEMKMLEDLLPVKRAEQAEINRNVTKFQKRSDRTAASELAAQIARDEERLKELQRLLDELELEAARNAVPLEWRR